MTGRPSNGWSRSATSSTGDNRSSQFLDKYTRRRAHLVSAFGTVPSEVLFAVFEARRRAKRPSVVYCGDHQGAKNVAATLIRDVGFDPVHAGPLRIVRYLEPFGLLVGQLAYETDGGPQVAYCFDRFATEDGGKG